MLAEVRGVPSKARDVFIGRGGKRHVGQVAFLPLGDEPKLRRPQLPQTQRDRWCELGPRAGKGRRDTLLCRSSVASLLSLSSVPCGHFNVYTAKLFTNTQWRSNCGNFSRASPGLSPPTAPPGETRVPHSWGPEVLGGNYPRGYVSCWDSVSFHFPSVGNCGRLREQTGLLAWQSVSCAILTLP